MKFVNEEAFTFDDVLLQPQYNEIKSRKDVSLKTKLTKSIEIDIPIISSNMDTVTESVMAKKMHHLGGIGIIHRFMTIENTIECLQSMHPVQRFIVSIGFNDDFEKRMTVYREFQVAAICVDVAHGWCDRMFDMIKRIKDFYPEVDVIAGNVASPDAAADLCRVGADAIKVGIGPGSMCTTRLVTGCGVPQLTAIMECAEIAKIVDVPIIADGGIKTSGDIVKALAAGASSVMLGSLLAGTDETPGEIIKENKGFLYGRPIYDSIGAKKYKKYRGMASKDCMTGWKGDYHAAPEGESKLIECKGPAENIIKDLLGGIRSGMTYCGASTIEELQNNAVFRKVTGNTLIENKPHGK